MYRFPFGIQLWPSTPVGHVSAHFLQRRHQVHRPHHVPSPTLLFNHILLLWFKHRFVHFVSLACHFLLQNTFGSIHYANFLYHIPGPREKNVPQEESSQEIQDENSPRRETTFLVEDEWYCAQILSFINDMKL